MNLPCLTARAVCLLLGGTMAIAHAAPGVEPADDKPCLALQAEVRAVDQAEARLMHDGTGRRIAGRLPAASAGP